MALRRVLLSSKGISSVSIFGGGLLDDSPALIVSTVDIFSGTKEKFKPLTNNDCLSDENEYDEKLTTVLLGFSAEFEPDLGRRD